MINKILSLLAKIFLGEGMDKKFPFLISLYQKVYFLLAKNEIKKVKIPLNCQLLVSTKDTGVSLYLLNKGQFEAKQTKLFLEKVKKGNVVLDIGANIGYYTVLASKLVGKKGKVYAFEPDKRNLKLLQKNLEINKCKNVKVISKAVGEKNGRVNFLINPLSQGESKINKSNANQERRVEAISLDDFVKKEKLERINVLKMDVEGAEIFVLKGGERFLKKTKNIKLFLECNPKSLKEFGFGVEDLLGELKKFGIRIELIINEFWGKTFSFSEKKLEKILKKFSFMGLYAEK